MTKAGAVNGDGMECTKVESGKQLKDTVSIAKIKYTYNWIYICATTILF